MTSTKWPLRYVHQIVLNIWRPQKSISRLPISGPIDWTQFRGQSQGPHLKVLISGPNLRTHIRGQSQGPHLKVLISGPNLRTQFRGKSQGTHLKVLSSGPNLRTQSSETISRNPSEVTQSEEPHQGPNLGPYLRDAILKAFCRARFWGQSQRTHLNVQISKRNSGEIWKSQARSILKVFFCSITSILCLSFKTIVNLQNF